MRRQMVVGLWLVSLAAMGVARAGEAAPAEDERAAVAAVVRQVNAAWDSADPAAAMRAVLSDRACTFVTPKPTAPRQALVLGKEEFCRLFERSLVEARPRHHEHRVHSITVCGPVAYELGVSVNVGQDGRERQDEVLNVFAREADGWKLVFSTPAANLRQALATPGAPAEVGAEAAKGIRGTPNVEEKPGSVGR